MTNQEMYLTISITIVVVLSIQMLIIKLVKWFLRDFDSLYAKHTTEADNKIKGHQPDTYLKEVVRHKTFTASREHEDFGGELTGEQSRKLRDIITRELVLQIFEADMFDVKTECTENLKGKCTISITVLKAKGK